MSIHPTAVVDPKAELDSSVEVGPFCVIEKHVRVAAGCRLYQGVFLTGWTSIGENCELHPGCVVGHAPQDTKYGGQRTFCRIGKGNVIREYVTIHRGTVPESETVIGDDCFLLAGSHIGHNCAIGNGVTLINNVMLAGHVTIEDRAIISGGAGVHQFVRIGSLAMVGGNAGVQMDIVPFALVDRSGRIAGVNRIGLRRADTPQEDIHEIREWYRCLFDSGLSISAAVEKFVETVRTPCGKKLSDFLRGESKRGFAGRSRGRGESADEESQD